MATGEEIIHMDIVTLFLCEQEHLVLRPNVLYLFEVGAACEECQRLAKVYEQEEK